MIYVIYRRQSFDYLVMCLVFFEFFAAYGQSYGIYAQSRIKICGIDFDIVDYKAELPDGSDEVLQVAAVGQFEMDLEMVGAVLQIFLNTREESKACKNCNEADQRYGIEACACGKA